MDQLDFGWKAPFFVRLLCILLIGFSTTAVSQQSLECSFVVTNSWGTGATANLQVINTGSAATQVGPITLTFTDGTRIINPWNIIVTGDNPYTLEFPAWAQPLGAGQSVALGMLLSTQGGVAPPELGGACAGGSAQNQPPVIELGDVSGMPPSQAQTFSATVNDPDGDLVSWDLTVYLDTLDGYQNPVVIDSGSAAGGTDSAALSGLFSTENEGAYAVVARATDSQGESAEASAEFAVASDPDGTIEITHADFAVVGQYTSASAESWHPTQVHFGGLSIRVQPAPASSESSTSSSSGGPSIGFSAQTTLTFEPAQPGTHTITATDSNLNLETSSTIEVYAEDPRPAVEIQAPQTAEPGDIVSITVTAQASPVINSDNDIASLTLDIDDTPLTPVSSTTTGEDGRNGLVNVYEWTAQGGQHMLSARAADLEEYTGQTSHTITVENASSGGCADQGIDADEVNDYPNWPNLDWQGNPSNANTGDLMEYQGSIYRAKWWTTSVPGSDQSWEFVCNI